MNKNALEKKKQVHILQYALISFVKKDSRIMRVNLTTLVKKISRDFNFAYERNYFFFRGNLISWINDFHKFRGS